MARFTRMLKGTIASLQIYLGTSSCIYWQFVTTLSLTLIHTIYFHSNGALRQKLLVKKVKVSGSISKQWGQYNPPPSPSSPDFPPTVWPCWVEYWWLIASFTKVFSFHLDELDSDMLEFVHLSPATQRVARSWVWPFMQEACVNEAVTHKFILKLFFTVSEH